MDIEILDYHSKFLPTFIPRGPWFFHGRTFAFTSDYPNWMMLIRIKVIILMTFNRRFSPDLNM